MCICRYARLQIQLASFRNFHLCFNLDCLFPRFLPLSTSVKMRLLNARTKQFEEFYNEVPPYAILSHTWGPDELTFKHMEQKGYVPSKKIDGCCKEALKDGLKFVWVDTCCIDKSSSSELSEAINSMWEWYRRSEVCYAYLSDVPPHTVVEEPYSSFSQSRWFTRGWTLQELIAPGVVVFYDEAWNLIGRKSQSRKYGGTKFRERLSQITGIDDEVLAAPSSFRDYSVAQRMSWASNRTTTRLEDCAYSLLGLFEINMPLLYGEGNRAFQRLQEEILRVSDDESLFAWGNSHQLLQPDDRAQSHSLFATGPSDFMLCGSIIRATPAGLRPSHYTITNKGLHIEPGFCYLPIQGGIAFALLNCAEKLGAGGEKNLAILLVQSKENNMIFSRPWAMRPICLPPKLFSNVGHIYLHKFLGHRAIVVFPRLEVQLSFGLLDKYIISELYPPSWRAIFEKPGLSWGDQLETLQSGHQDILFLVDHTDWKRFAVWIDYSFLLIDATLEPREIKCRVASVEGDITLAELLLRNRAFLISPIEGALDWKEVLDLGSVELRTELTKVELPYGETWTVCIKAH
jgi:hypothetical protein